MLTIALISNARISEGVIVQRNGGLAHLVLLRPPKGVVDLDAMFVNVDGLGIVHARHECNLFVQCAPEQLVLTT